MDRNGLVVLVYEECGKHSCLRMPYTDAERLLAVVKETGTVPMSTIFPEMKLAPGYVDTFKPVVYCAIAQIENPETQTYDTILKGPRL